MSNAADKQLHNAFDVRVDRLLTVASLAILLGCFAATILLWCEPFADSIDTIGLPLLLGYSEATERQTVTVFVGVALIASILLNLLIGRLDRTPWRSWCDHFCSAVGTFGLAFWLSVPIWSRFQTISWTWIAGLILVFGIARLLPRLNSLAEGWSVGTAICMPSLLVGQFYFGNHPPSWMGLILSTILAVMIEWGLQGFKISSSLSIRSGVRCAVLFSLLLLSLSNQTVALFIALVAFSFLSSRLIHSWSIEERVLAILIYLIGLLAVPQALGVEVIDSLVIGVLLGWLVECSFEERIRQSFADPVTRLNSLLIASAFGLILHSTLHSAWLIVASLIVIVISRLQSTTLRLILPLVLLASCFLSLDAHSVQKFVDPIHDGQIVSAVWQWKQGEILFDQVFPLRLTEFLYFAALDPWVGESRANYVIACQMLDFLGPVGVFAIASGMTHSPSWSWISALFVGAILPFDYRAGICMILLGIAAYLLRSPAIRVVPLSLVGLASMWMGYDAWGTVMGAIGGAILMTPPHAPVIPSLRKNVLKLIVCGAWTLGIFMATLAVWQGWSAVAAYFTLFLEYAREYSAFYGYPAFRVFSELQTTLIPVGILLGWGLASLVCRWREMSLTRRRHLVMLIVSMTLFTQRALARSDFQHLKTLWYPSVVFSLIGLYWLMQYLRDYRWRWNAMEPLVGMVLLVVAIHFYRGPAFPPRTWFQDSGMKQPLHWPEPNDLIAARLGPTDSLWEIQDGLWPFTYHRRNPTGHVLAYCMGWPKEASRAVRAMEEDPPKVISFRPSNGIDHISSLLWNPVITHFLYEHYRPVLGTDILEPSPNRWRGWSREYEGYSPDFHLRRLPIRWGENLDHFSPRTLEKWVIESKSSGIREEELLAVTVALARIPSPRDHLLLRLNVALNEVDDPILTIRFVGPDGGLDEASRIDFEGKQGSGVYLIPVGLSPAWSWRERIAALQISSEELKSCAVEQAEIWELRPAE